MNKQKMIRAAGFVIGVTACITAIASISYNPNNSTYGASYKGFRATAGDYTDFDNSNAELLQHDLHYTSSADYIRMGPGDDFIYMADDDDSLNMGPGDDNIDFYGDSSSTEKILFVEGEAAGIKWTGASVQGGSGSNDLEIKTTDGDVIIVLAD